MVFVDLEKAFNRGPREVVWWASRSLEVKERWASRSLEVKEWLVSCKSYQSYI